MGENTGAQPFAVSSLAFVLPSRLQIIRQAEAEPQLGSGTCIPTKHPTIITIQNVSGLLLGVVQWRARTRRCRLQLFSSILSNFGVAVSACHSPT